VSWVDVFGSPGFNLAIFYVTSGLYLWRFAKQKKWDAFEILDFWILGVVTSLILIWVGYFLAGISFGIPTGLPWGLVFPGVFDQHHPVQIYYVIYFSLLLFYLTWVEYRYRTFGWYRAGKNTAQTGFLISMFLILTGVASLAMSIVAIPNLVVLGVRTDLVGAAVMTVVGIIMLFYRSGRQLPGQKKKKRQSRLEEFSL
jgi:hypothetical protein